MSISARQKPFAPIRIQPLLLAALLVAAPFAISFKAYEKICSNLPIQADPLYLLRAVFIIGGLTIAILSVAMLVWVISKQRFEYLVSQLSMTLCSFTIGWVYFPFWVNGVFQAYRGNGPDCPLNIYDPKYLPPAIWLGGIWQLGAILNYILVMAGGLALFALAIFLLLVNRDWKQGGLTLICLALTLAIIILFPGCATWVLD